jgi:sirohydrochlorin cobaltochelatase
VGYNEFRVPSLDEALDQAAERGAGRVIVVTPMMPPGGEHAEEDIPAATGRAEERHPMATFAYAWPFRVEDVARLLATQVDSPLERPETGFSLEAGPGSLRTRGW